MQNARRKLMASIAAGFLSATIAVPGFALAQVAPVGVQGPGIQGGTVTGPGVTEMEWLGSAPLPSTRSLDPFSSARLITTAASARVARAPTISTGTANTHNHR